MTVVLEYLSGLFLFAGALLCITGGVGLLRMPDFFSRVHASGVTETLATTLLLTGLLLQMDWSLDSVKVIMILALVLSIGPIATHAMAKATLHGGQRPLVFDGESAEKKAVEADRIERHAAGVVADDSAANRATGENKTEGETPSKP